MDNDKIGSFILDFLRNLIRDKNYKKNISVKIENKAYGYDFYNV